MRFDNVMNLQAELFRGVFDFIEMTEPMASTAAKLLIPTYVDPRTFDERVVLVEPFAISADTPEPSSVTISEGKQLLATERRAGRTESRETDDIALGVGMGNATGSEDYELVVVYQARRLEKGAFLSRIAEHSRGEVRMVYSGRARASAPWHRELNATLRMGSSIGHRKVTAGTLGCFVRHQNTGHRGVLSNNHVLANVNNAAIDDAVIQPGRKDGGTLTNRMASLQGFIPILFGGASNQVDCAWASHDDPPRAENRQDRFDSAENVVGQLAGDTPSDALPGGFVLKVGRTTGYTQGEVDAININNLNVNMGGSAIARFDGQIQIKSLSRVPFSRPGDSGSLVVDINSEPTGLLFAGSPSGGFENTGLTWANPIATVLNNLGLEIVA
jgi:hypothetical protein